MVLRGVELTAFAAITDAIETGPALLDIYSNYCHALLSLSGMAISGNLDTDILEVFQDIPHYFGMNRRADEGSPAFGDSIIARLVVTHASVEKAEDHLDREGKLVCELTVTEDMLNGRGTVHGGCSALLVDVCSSLALFVLQPEIPSVSSSMNVVYHSPATVGETLRIVNSTIAVGARAMSARTEIWSATKNRLVASAIQIMVQPSAKL
ncbi:4HBT domain-containing protein [Mycena sanguinolenta]|uniref:4HBT domain-containing protein n=1 Tax=Mycena sanguinolenta TaxID=230812 RepID=A0A8H7DP05_9AGAR|nr:4HBT domain-containing protein [Mycena sanguinolenta]